MPIDNNFLFIIFYSNIGLGCVCVWVKEFLMYVAGEFGKLSPPSWILHMGINNNNYNSHIVYVNHGVTYCSLKLLNGEVLWVWEGVEWKGTGTNMCF